MSSLSSNTLSYKTAIAATEGIESPALGFIKPSEFTRGAQSGPSAIIKQNNTLLELVIRLTEKVQELQQDVKDIKRQVAAKQPAVGTIPEDILEKFKNLSLGTGAQPSERPGKLRVFRDPAQILKTEQEKLLLKQ